jgi:hypothetical protein
MLTDSLLAPVLDTCNRDTASEDLVARAEFVRDSLEQNLRDRSQPPYLRLVNTTRVVSTRTLGCFDGGRMILIVSLRAGNVEYAQERAVLLSDSGAVTPLRVGDLRFRAHDVLYAFDADGDGFDELAVRGLTELAGALVILKPTGRKSLDRLTAGFAWEAR